jgi:hypothetical protein
MPQSAPSPWPMPSAMMPFGGSVGPQFGRMAQTPYGMGGLKGSAGPQFVPFGGSVPPMAPPMARSAGPIAQTPYGMGGFKGSAGPQFVPFGGSEPPMAPPMARSAGPVAQTPYGMGGFTPSTVGPGRIPPFRPQPYHGPQKPDPADLSSGLEGLLETFYATFDPHGLHERSSVPDIVAAYEHDLVTLNQLLRRRYGHTLVEVCVTSKSHLEICLDRFYKTFSKARPSSILKKLVNDNSVAKLNWKLRLKYGHDLDDVIKIVLHGDLQPPQNSVPGAETLNADSDCNVVPEASAVSFSEETAKGYGKPAKELTANNDNGQDEGALEQVDAMIRIRCACCDFPVEEKESYFNDGANYYHMACWEQLVMHIRLAKRSMFEEQMQKKMVSIQDAFKLGLSEENIPSTNAKTSSKFIPEKQMDTVAESETEVHSEHVNVN